jgi:hypothetical protein
MDDGGQFNAGVSGGGEAQRRVKRSQFQFRAALAAEDQAPAARVSPESGNATWTDVPFSLD